ncbi:MAG: deoxyribose-phosphate aldolase [Erysipelotrichaceae bacterium]|nr:deoxyribose-phosphate aldolase [Erysipelotrichaceae bacterium]
MKMSKYIDHTLLKANATKEQILKLCEEAKTYDFASVCVNAVWVKTCADALKETDVKVCTVVGFPLGATTSAVKAYEAKEAIANGADEIDMVMNIGAMKSKDYQLVEDDIRAVVEACAPHVVKVIIETCLLTDEEKVKACELSVAAHAAFVKTSTGFSTAGATVEDVRLMKETVKDACEVKAAGGVRTAEDFDNMVKAGATRIGTSGGCQLLAGKNVNTSY